MTEIFLFSHPPYCLLDLVTSILIFFFKVRGYFDNYKCCKLCVLKFTGPMRSS